MHVPNFGVVFMFILSADKPMLSVGADHSRQGREQLGLMRRTVGATIFSIGRCR